MEPENTINIDIKGSLKQAMEYDEFGPAGKDCPYDNELADYIGGIACYEKKQLIAEHLSTCDRCLGIVATGTRVLNAGDWNKKTKVPKRIIRKAKGIPGQSGGRIGRSRIIIALRRNKYIILSGVFFALSFIRRGYFLQFLLASGVFGIKWVMDTGSTKALIMIYDTWVSRKPGEDIKNRAHSEKNNSRNKRAPF